MNKTPSPETIALLNDLQATLNKHNLNYRESFMVVTYLSVMIARAAHMPLNQLIEMVTDIYGVDEALDKGVQ
jgi:hypothetical protein